jgi:hypothetical protein
MGTCRIPGQHDSLAPNYSSLQFEPMFHSIHRESRAVTRDGIDIYGPGGRPRALVMARGSEGEFVEIDNLISTAVVYMTAAAGTNENYLEMGTPQRGPMLGVDAPRADQPRGSTFRFSTRCLR